MRELARCPGEAMVEKRLEQCTNPFILLVCQRLVRAGWSQHVCRAPSRPPPPREVPGEQLGAVAEEARGGGSTVWQGTGWGNSVPLCPPTGMQAAAPGTYPGCLPRDPFPGPGGPYVQLGWGGGGGNQALPAWDCPGSSRPRAGFIAGGRAGSPAVRRGGSQHNAVGSPGDSGGLRGWGGGGSVSSGHEDAWSDGTHPGTETLMREPGGGGGQQGRDTDERAVGDGRDGAGGDEAGGGPCPVRAFVHGRRSAAPAPPGAEVLQSN